MAIKDKEFLSKKDSLSLIKEGTLDTSKYLQEQSERYPNNIKSSAGSMIIHLHSKDQNILMVNNLNKNCNGIKEEDFEESMDKHFPKKENKENNENTADELSTPSKAAAAASERVANFIKNSIKKKIQYN